MDVKSAFLNGVLEEEIYVEYPLGYEIEGVDDKFYHLKKALYGLKQAPSAWYSHIDSYFMSNNFSISNGEPTLYIKQSIDMFLTVVLYVDVLIFMGSDKALIEEFKKEMKGEFEMTNLGLLKFLFGIEVQQLEHGIFISQSKYTEVILKRFRMETYKPAPTPTTMGIKLRKKTPRRV